MTTLEEYLEVWNTFEIFAREAKTEYFLGRHIKSDDDNDYKKILTVAEGASNGVFGRRRREKHMTTQARSIEDLHGARDAGLRDVGWADGVRASATQSTGNDHSTSFDRDGGPLSGARDGSRRADLQRTVCGRAGASRRSGSQRGGGFSGNR